MTRKNILYFIFAANVILLIINLYVGSTRKTFNYLNIFSNVTLAIAMFILAKKDTNK